jgi:hypothetical protein
VATSLKITEISHFNENHVNLKFLDGIEDMEL